MGDYERQQPEDAVGLPEPSSEPSDSELGSPSKVGSSSQSVDRGSDDTAVSDLDPDEGEEAGEEPEEVLKLRAGFFAALDMGAADGDDDEDVDKAPLHHR